MNPLFAFAADRRGSVVIRFANAAALIVILGVAMASLLDYATRGKDSPLARWALREGLPHGIDSAEATDPMPTGSIGRVVLDPCTGQRQ